MRLSRRPSEFLARSFRRVPALFQASSGATASFFLDRVTELLNEASQVGDLEVLNGIGEQQESRAPALFLCAARPGGDDQRGARLASLEERERLGAARRQSQRNRALVLEPLADRSPDGPAVLVDQRKHVCRNAAWIGAVQAGEGHSGDADDDHRRHGEEHEPDPIAQQQTQILGQRRTQRSEHQRDSASERSSRSARPVSVKNTSARFGR